MRPLAFAASQARLSCAPRAWPARRWCSVERPRALAAQERQRVMPRFTEMGESGAV
jgi:hypothetical protein